MIGKFYFKVIGIITHVCMSVCPDFEVSVAVLSGDIQQVYREGTRLVGSPRQSGHRCCQMMTWSCGASVLCSIGNRILTRNVRVNCEIHQCCFSSPATAITPRPRTKALSVVASRVRNKLSVGVLACWPSQARTPKEKSLPHFIRPQESTEQLSWCGSG